MLLEREELLAALSERLDEADGRSGSLVLVAGEAGAGKTSLVRAFADSQGRSTLVIRGACDPLATPRPLSPVYDFAADPEGGLDDLDFGAENIDVFRQVLDRLKNTIRPILIVVEDIHWADQATLDFIRFIGRRIGDTRSMMVCTYRDDEVGPDHPLRPVLGQLIPLDTTSRLTVPMLSREAVGILARGSGLDADQLHVMTGGNPFFVTEVVASGDAIPATVHDAVVARLTGLGPGALEAVQAVSIAPRALEVDRTLTLVGGRVDDVDEAVSAGVLLGDGKSLRFRHELARSAVEQSVPPAKRHALHRRMLALLLEEEYTDHARLAHHAIQADAPDLIVEHAPLAARDAIERAARREAISLFEAALEYSDLIDADSRARIRVEVAREYRIIDRPDRALEHVDRAIEHYRHTGQDIALAEALGVRQANLWNLSRIPEGWKAHDEAIRLLGPHGDTVELGMAHYQAGHHHMLARHGRPAEEAVEEARRVGAALGNEEILWLSEMIRGTVAIVMSRPHEGMTILQSCLEEARRMGHPRFEGIALGMLGSGGGEARLYDQAVGYLDEDVEWSKTNDEDFGLLYAKAWLARIAFERGQWDEAVSHVDEVLRLSQRTDGIAMLTALGALGRVRARRGDPQAKVTLERAVQMGKANEFQHVWSPICGLAEHHWLNADLASMQDLLSGPFERAMDTDSEWARGEVGFWMWRAGGIDSPPPGAALPYAQQMGGRWREAAQTWREIGCPYEVALALADGDEEAMVEALTLFDLLGAAPAARTVRSRLQAAGVEAIPRGPTKSTLANPAGLTGRQLEVLRLIAAGHTNGQIAEELFVSKKTVEHHVSAIYAKLGVGTRAQAIARASEIATET